MVHARKTAGSSSGAALPTPWRRCCPAGAIVEHRRLACRVNLSLAQVEVCPRCGGRATIEFVTAKDKIEQLLQSIGYPNAPGVAQAPAA